ERRFAAAVWRGTGPSAHEECGSIAARIGWEPGAIVDRRIVRRRSVDDRARRGRAVEQYREQRTRSGRNVGTTQPRLVLVGEAGRRREEANEEHEPHGCGTTR